MSEDKIESEKNESKDAVSKDLDMGGAESKDSSIGGAESKDAVFDNVEIDGAELPAKESTGADKLNTKSKEILPKTVEAEGIEAKTISPEDIEAGIVKSNGVVPECAEADEAKSKGIETEGVESKSLETCPPKPSLLYWIPAAIVSLICGLTAAWNAILNINTHYIGSGELEGWLWRYWWFKELMTSLITQTDKNWRLIIYTYLCAGNYPETGNVFDFQTLSLMLEPIFGAPAYYNVKIVVILFLNGIAGYALAKYLTGRPIISMAAAVVLAFNPFVVFEITNGRPRHAILFSLPLFAMYLIDTYRTLSLKSALLAGFWLGISSAIYLYYGMSALFFGLIFIVIQLLTERKNFTFTFVKYVVVILILFLLVSGPFAYRYIEIIIKNEKLPEVSWQKDFPPLEYLLQDSSEIDPRDMLGMSIMRYRSDSPPVCYPFRFTYHLNIPLIITLLTLIPLLFKRPVPWLWIITGLFFFILSLGPYLRFGVSSEDNYVRLLPGQPVPLLYTFMFKYVPFFSRLFAPIRLKAMMYVAISVLTAVNLKFIFDLIFKPKTDAVEERSTEDIPKEDETMPKESFFLSIISFIKTKGRPIAESAAVIILFAAVAGQMFYAKQLPIVLTEVNYPKIYDEIAKEEGNIGVIEVPFRFSDSANYYQMFHGKKLLWGWTFGSIPPGFPESKALYLSKFDDIKQNTFVIFLEELNRSPQTPKDFKREDLAQLRAMGYKYLILNERVCYEYTGGNIQTYDLFFRHLKEALGKPVMQDMETGMGRFKRIEGKIPQWRVSVFEIKEEPPKEDLPKEDLLNEEPSKEESVENTLQEIERQESNS